jgi:predicted choloylglycine hydrolase
MSAVAKGRFSATINWLPWTSSGLLPGWVPKPNLFGWPASFLLRYIFERCKTFEDALNEIKRTKVVSPVLITLVGPKKGQAVAVERGTKHFRVRRYKKAALVATNHYLEAEKNRSKSEMREDETYNFTYRRKFLIEEKVQRVKISKLSDAFQLLQRKPVFNECTTQSMVFSVTTGKALVRTF